MLEFEGKVAVVTGAASGIGRAMAERFAAAKMRVVLADVEEAALRNAEESLLERGANVLAVRADVRKLESIEELRNRAIDAFGKVHVLCNNAGVSAAGLSWEQSNADWEWTLGVNLWGVIHAVRTFLPGMIAHGEEGHVVNTASVAGLIAGPHQGPYAVSKFGVVALSETMYWELKGIGSKIGVSVLCPGFVNTRIIESERNRPVELGESAGFDAGGLPEFRARLAAGHDPADVAQQVLDGIVAQQLHILTDTDFDELIRGRVERILTRQKPETSLPSE